MHIWIYISLYIFDEVKLDEVRCKLLQTLRQQCNANEWQHQSNLNISRIVKYRRSVTKPWEILIFACNIYICIHIHTHTIYIDTWHIRTWCTYTCRGSNSEPEPEPEHRLRTLPWRLKRRGRWCWGGEVRGGWGEEEPYNSVFRVIIDIEESHCPSR